MRRVTPHLPRVRRMLARLLPASDAEDVLQEVLLHAYVCVPGLRRPELFGAWVRTVAYNQAMQWHRRRYAEAGLGPRLWHPGDPTGGVGQIDARVDVVAALGLLSSRDREAVVLRYVHGWTSEEIGRLQGRLAATVRWRLHRARDALRAELRRGHAGPGSGLRQGRRGCRDDGEPDGRGRRPTTRA